MAEKMRLVCPNCSAQYEVDSAVIPVAGRDVQCSNCGHTWWQRRVGTGASPEPAAPAAEPEPGPDAETAAPDAAGEAAARTVVGNAAEAAGSGAPAAGDLDAIGAEIAAEAGTAPLPAPEAAPGAPSQPGADARSDADGWADEDDDDAPGPPPPAALAGRRRSLDEAVLDVLREEAEREALARQGQGGTDVSPDDAALIATLGRGADEREADVRARMDALDGTGRPGGRGNQRLPDVEEINSTLEGRVSETAAAAAAAGDGPSLVARHRRRAGFRLGFTTMLAVALAILLSYIFADRIVARVPSMEPGMTRFVQTVDAGRNWLNGATTRATEAIRRMTQTE